jgi:hypothetical protein
MLSCHGFPFDIEWYARTTRAGFSAPWLSSSFLNVVNNPPGTRASSAERSSTVSEFFPEACEENRSAMRAGEYLAK